jgi:hypothetical protein
MRFFNSTPGQNELVVTGLAGFLGALLLFAGDMRMYGHCELAGATPRG